MSGDTYSSLAGPLSMEEIAAALISDTAPLSESSVPAPGMMTKAQGAGHRHERLTSATYVTTGVDGTQTAVFTRSFAAMPCPVMSAINNPSVICDVVSWIRETMLPSPAGAYTGAVIRAVKRTAGTTNTGVTVVGIPVISGVTATTADTPVPSQLISVIMLQQSAPA